MQGKYIRRKVSFVGYVLAAPKIATLEGFRVAAVLAAGQAKHGLGYLVLQQAIAVTLEETEEFKQLRVCLSPFL